MMVLGIIPMACVNSELCLSNFSNGLATQNGVATLSEGAGQLSSQSAAPLLEMGFQPVRIRYSNIIKPATASTSQSAQIDQLATN